MKDDLNNLFPSFSVCFKNQTDFNEAIKLPESKHSVDISYSERIVNFDNKQDRQNFTVGLFIKGISEKNYELNED